MGCVPCRIPCPESPGAPGAGSMDLPMWLPPSRLLPSLAFQGRLVDLPTMRLTDGADHPRRRHATKRRHASDGDSSAAMQGVEVSWTRRVAVLRGGLYSSGIFPRLVSVA